MRAQKGGSWLRYPAPYVRKHTDNNDRTEWTMWLHLRALQVVGLSVVTQQENVLFQVAHAPVLVVTHTFLARKARSAVEELMEPVHIVTACRTLKKRSTSTDLLYAVNSIPGSHSLISTQCTCCTVLGPALLFAVLWKGVGEFLQNITNSNNKMWDSRNILIPYFHSNDLGNQMGIINEGERWNVTSK